MLKYLHIRRCRSDSFPFSLCVYCKLPGKLTRLRSSYYQVWGWLVLRGPPYRYSEIFFLIWTHFSLAVTHSFTVGVVSPKWLVWLFIFLKFFLAGFGSGSGFTTHSSIIQCLDPHSLNVTGSSFISDCELKSSFVYCFESGYSFLPIFSICLFVCLQASAELWPYFRLILSGEVLFRDRWDWSTLSPLYRTQVRDTQVTEYTFCPARCYPGTGEAGPLSLHCTVRR